MILGSTILDIAIGMVFIYLLLSLAVTAANELIAGLFKSRGKHLRKGIAALLPEKTAKEVYGHPLVDGLSRSMHPSYIPSRTFALALLDVISGNDGKVAEISKLPEAISQLPKELSQPMLVLLGEAKGDVDKFKAHLEIWFENSMDRVSGWYKRKTQFILFGLGLGITISLNADSLMLINHLSRDTSLRAALVAQAEGASRREIPAASSSADASEKEIQRARDDFAASTRALRELNLPIGWVSTDAWAAAPYEHREELEGRVWPKGFGDKRHPIGQLLRAHLLGWLLTALAISLGAPFWFDVLNKFVNIRAAGKAPEERPKEPKEVPLPVGPGQKPHGG